jgi:hypothetical protein
MFPGLIVFPENHENNPFDLDGPPTI